jgi:hypothetical protein
VFVASWSTPEMGFADPSDFPAILRAWTVRVRPHLLDEETGACCAVSATLLQGDRPAVHATSFARYHDDGGLVGC